MTQPTLNTVKAANPVFFCQYNSRLFGDNKYSIKGHTLTIHSKRETSDRQTIEESQDYAINPQTLSLNAIAIDRDNHKPYIFIQPDNSGPVLTQYLMTDGSPDGSPTTNQPNQHERQSTPTD